ncbi:hypothetical protein GFS60_02010 [Rhodococcus sp. WAY2]|nr:hypothetical protein GFS60_02010 [Rhodococcus sp. WAY2]
MLRPVRRWREVWRRVCTARLGVLPSPYVQLPAQRYHPSARAASRASANHADAGAPG